MLAFFDFPRDHWAICATSEPRSKVSFSTVRIRTVRTNGALSSEDRKLKWYFNAYSSCIDRNGCALKGPKPQFCKSHRRIKFNDGVEK